MLIKDCEGCRFRIWMVGIGQGVRCGHPDHREITYVGSQPPVISKIVDCRLYTAETKPEKEK